MVLLKVLATSSYAYAQDDDITVPDQETFVPSSNGTPPPVIIDESDSSGVSDVEEYDG